MKGQHQMIRRLAHRIALTRRTNSSSGFYQRSGGLLSSKTKRRAEDSPTRVWSRSDVNPPHIMELSVNELSAYQNDIQSLELFVDQLVTLPVLKFAEHIQTVLEMTKAHGLRGSKLAQRLLPILNAAVSEVAPEVAPETAPETAPEASPLAAGAPEESPLAAISTAIATAEYQQDLHIFDVKKHELEKTHCDIYRLEKFVSQVEDAAYKITDDQLTETVLPLSRVVAMKQHGERGAQLTERILMAVHQSPMMVPASLYNRSMIAWGNQRESSEHVRRIWKLLVQDKDVKLLQRHYKSYIRGIAPTDAPEAYHILRHEFEPAAGVPALLGETPTKSMTPSVDIPDLSTYNLVAMAYAKSPIQHPHRMMRVLEIMERVDQLHQVTQTHEWDGHSYVALFLTHRNLLRLPNADGMDMAQRIETILKKLHDRLKRQDEEKIQQRSIQQKRNLDGNDFANRDTDTLLFPLSMSWAYDIMIEAYLKSGQSDKAIEMVLHMMHGTNGLYECPPRNSTLIMLADRLSTEQRNSILQRCVLAKKYQRVHFLHVDMEAWASLPAPQPPYIAQLVEAMLLHSFANYTAKRNKPTGLTFRVAIKAWMRCEDKVMGLTHIENMMIEMMNVSKVDTWYALREVHVRLWMTAFLQMAATGQRFAVSGVKLYPAEHCERIVKLCRPFFTRLNIQTSFVAIAIRAWALQEGDDIDEIERLKRVDALLNSIQTDEIPPYPANWVLSTCCRDFKGIEQQQRAYQVASTIFVRKNVQLNPRSYELMIEIVHKIRKDEVLVMELFRRACLAGLVSQEAICRVADIVTSAEDLQKLFRLDYGLAQMIVSSKDNLSRDRLPGPLRLENLPREWSANIDRTKHNERKQANKNDEEDDDDGSSFGQEDEDRF